MAWYRLPNEMMPPRPQYGWSAAATYEEFMGRWSRPLAEEFVRWVDPEPGGHWLDVGAGTGALASAICRIARPASAVACDLSAPFIESAKQEFYDSRLTFQVAGVGELPQHDGGFDAVVSGLALNFFPDSGLAMLEKLGALRPGGMVGAYVWDYAAGMEFLMHFWAAATSIEPAAAEHDERQKFAICESGALEALFESVGAERVKATSLTVPTSFSSFDDYWRPFLGSTGPAPSLVSGLTEERRQALEDELRQRLPIQEDGQIDLQARAWAVVGHRT